MSFVKLPNFTTYYLAKRRTHRQVLKEGKNTREKARKREFQRTGTRKHEHTKNAIQREVAKNK